MHLNCEHCYNFPVPTVSFKELSISPIRHSSLWQCVPCGHLLELVEEERHPHPISIAQAATTFPLLPLPIVVPHLQCKHCSQKIHLTEVVKKSPRSWPAIRMLWHQCAACPAINHIKIATGYASVIEIDALPGSEIRSLEVARVADQEATVKPGGLEVCLGASRHLIASKRAL
jgi:hypothetical protein